VHNVEKTLKEMKEMISVNPVIKFCVRLSFHEIIATSGWSVCAISQNMKKKI